ncbi:hypothetical protein NSQ59_27455 [Margalitia sp. FSL K6-0131]|uniref:hypothetical protein n=1 Tax=Margalitia sp. FSL K6-0131 TaxID=2954604 RepID=UPI0030FB0669
MEIYILYGLKETIECYELSSFADIYFDFTKAKEVANEELKELLDEYEIDIDEHLDIHESNDSYSIFLYKEAEIRFELSIKKKVFSHERV